jgi:transposase
MARRKPRIKPLGTIWEIPDELWRRIEPILKEFWPRKATGRHVANWRKMRGGGQWEKLPERYGPRSTVHDRFQRWVEGGIFEKIWALLVAECDELGGVRWEWRRADAILGQVACSPFLGPGIMGVRGAVVHRMEPRSASRQ